MSDKCLFKLTNQTLTFHEEVKGNTTVNKISDTVGGPVHFVSAFIFEFHQRYLKNSRLKLSQKKTFLVGNFF